MDTKGMHPKTKLKIGLPRFFLNFKLYLIEKLWGAFVNKNVRLKSSGPWITVQRPQYTTQLYVQLITATDGTNQLKAVYEWMVVSDWFALSVAADQLVTRKVVSCTETIIFQKEISIASIVW